MKVLSVVSVVLVLTAFGNIMDLSNDKEGDTSPLMGSEVVSEYSNSGDQVGSPSPSPGVEPTSSQTPTLDTQDDSEDIDPAPTEAPSSVVNSSPGVDEEPPVVSPTESPIPQEEQGSTPQIEPFASRRISPLYGYNSITRKRRMRVFSGLVLASVLRRRRLGIKRQVRRRCGTQNRCFITVRVTHSVIAIGVP